MTEKRLLEKLKINYMLVEQSEHWMNRDCCAKISLLRLKEVS